MPVRDFTKSVTGKSLLAIFTSKFHLPSQANIIKFITFKFRVQRYEENLNCARKNVKIFKWGSPLWGGRERGGCLPTAGRAGSGRAGRAGGGSDRGRRAWSIPQRSEDAERPRRRERPTKEGLVLTQGAPGGAHGSGD